MSRSRWWRCRSPLPLLQTWLVVGYPAHALPVSTIQRAIFRQPRIGFLVPLCDDRQPPSLAAPLWPERLSAPTQSRLCVCSKPNRQRGIWGVADCGIWVGIPAANRRGPWPDRSPDRSRETADGLLGLLALLAPCPSGYWSKALVST